MFGIKSAILAIFQNSADWLDWPCPVSAALQNGSQDFFSLSFLEFIVQPMVLKNFSALFLLYILIYRD